MFQWNWSVFKTVRAIWKRMYSPWKKKPHGAAAVTDLTAANHTDAVLLTFCFFWIYFALCCDYGVSFDMSLLTVIKRNLYTTFMLVQIVFITVQIFVFYPCIVSAPAEWYNKAMHPIETVVNSVQLQQPKVDSRKYKPNWQSLQKRKLPDWYDEAKIGVLLQWGVFSVPSFVDSGSKGLSELFWFYWKHDEDFVEPNDKAARKHYKDLVKHADTASRSVKEYMTRTYPPGWHYTDFASQFTAEFFDPDHWAEILKSSGAK